MSNEAMTWVWARTDLKPGPKMVLLAIADYADDKGECYPGIAKTAQRCGMAQRSVIRLIRALEQGGFLETTRRGGTGTGRRSNTYRMTKFMEEKAEASCQNGTKPDEGNMTTSQGQGDNDDGQGDNETPYPLENPENKPLDLCAPEQPSKPGYRFEDWWKAYPKKVKKKTAREKWIKRGLDKMAEQLISDVNRRMQHDDKWQRGFIPDPTTYINEDRWLDIITKPANTKPGNGQQDPKGAAHSKAKVPDLKRTDKETGISKTKGLKAAIKGATA